MKKLDISGNMIDISIIHAIRSAMDTNSTQNNLEVSKYINKCIANNKELINLDIKDISESFNNTPENNKRSSRIEKGSTLKLSISKLNMNHDSGRKDDSENRNMNNIYEKVQDYSARVREINKKKFKPSKNLTTENTEDSTKLNIYEIPRPKAQDFIPEEDSKLSKSTENFITSYQEYREKQNIDSFYPRGEKSYSDLSLTEEENDTELKESSLQYSLSSHSKNSGSSSSISNYYSAGKTNYYSKIPQSSIDLASEFSTYRRKIEEGKVSFREMESDSEEEDTRGKIILFQAIFWHIHR